ncbi:hypothetical protein [Hydrogenimonas sp. SS33]
MKSKNVRIALKVVEEHREKFLKDWDAWFDQR